jgi:hypothetical protein
MQFGICMHKFMHICGGVIVNMLKRLWPWLPGDSLNNDHIDTLMFVFVCMYSWIGLSVVFSCAALTAGTAIIPCGI